MAGGLRINIESVQGELVGPFPQALCLSEDGRCVPETSVDAKTLLVGKGGMLSRERAEKHGAMKHLEPEAEKPAPKKAPAKPKAKKDEE